MWIQKSSSSKKSEVKWSVCVLETKMPRSTTLRSLLLLINYSLVSTTIGGSRKQQSSSLELNNQQILNCSKWKIKFLRFPWFFLSSLLKNRSSNHKVRCSSTRNHSYRRRTEDSSRKVNSLSLHGKWTRLQTFHWLDLVWSTRTSHSIVSTVTQVLQTFHTAICILSVDHHLFHSFLKTCRMTHADKRHHQTTFLSGNAVSITMQFTWWSHRRPVIVEGGLHYSLVCYLFEPEGTSSYSLKEKYLSKRKYSLVTNILGTLRRLRTRKEFKISVTKRYCYVDNTLA
jgi:hypothetical protein